jgi:acetate kinase
MRDVLAGVDEGDVRCELAYDVWLFRLAGAVAAMTAAMNGLDGLVFTAGIGEHSPRARADACTRLRFLGVDVETQANASAEADAVIGDRVVVVTAREDRQIASEVRAVLRLGVRPPR